MTWFKRNIMAWFRPKPKPEPAWTDPLDPHGDGTLREGDPVFDAMMRGNAVHGNFGPGGWKFDEYPDGTAS
jgi:hypothetical protein